MANMARNTAHSSSGPWVIFNEVNNSKTKGYTLIPPFAPLKPSAKTILELSGKITVASYYGWLIVADSKDPASVFLFHPFSRVTIDLPRLDILSDELLVSKDHGIQFVMTCAPDDNDNDNDNERCVVMVSYKSLLVFCRPGYDRSWSTHHARVKLKDARIDSDVLGVRNGFIHRLIISSQDDCLLFRITIHDCPNDSNLSITVKCVSHMRLRDLNSSHQSTYTKPYLVESSGELYCVVQSGGHGEYTDIQDIRVLKFVEKDSSETLDVIEVPSLGNQSLFISCNNNSSFGYYIAPNATPTSPLVVQANCVYILATLAEQIIYKYDLHDHTLTPTPLFRDQRVRCCRFFWVSSTEKKRNTDEDEETELDTLELGETVVETRHGTQFGDLTYDVIANMMMHMVLTDFSRFRATCKKHRDLRLPLQSWSCETQKIKYLESTKSQLVLPWLLLFKDNSRMCNVIDPIHTDQVYLMTTPWDRSYGTMEVVYSKQGWLLMHGVSGHLFFYNPFTKVMCPITGTDLPENRIDCHLRCLGSSTIPPSNTGMVVGLHHARGELFINSYVYGDRQWAILAVDPKKKPFVPANNTPVYYKNSFYFLDVIGRLARLTVTTVPNRRSYWKVLSNLVVPVTYNSTRMATYLLECDGYIFSVFACLVGRWVKLFRLDLKKMCWVQVDDIQNRMIFLSPTSSFAAPAPINRPEFGNKIYFSRIYESHGLVCYDLRAQKYCSPSKESDSGESLYHTKQLLCCTWIDPNWF